MATVVLAVATAWPVCGRHGVLHGCVAARAVACGQCMVTVAIVGVLHRDCGHWTVFQWPPFGEPCFSGHCWGLRWPPCSEAIGWRPWPQATVEAHGGRCGEHRADGNSAVFRVACRVLMMRRMMCFVRWCARSPSESKETEPTWRVRGRGHGSTSANPARCCSG